MSSERKHRRVARTEDRVESREQTCAYPPCGDVIPRALINEGYIHCSDECYFYHLSERDNQDTEEEDE